MSCPSGAACRIAPPKRLSPGAGERRKRVAARQRADRGRHSRTGEFLSLRVEDRCRLVGLEGAQRSDARQQQASPAACRKQRLGQRLTRALRRHVDRRIRQRHRSARAGEAIDKRPIQKRTAQCRQKRRPGGNREDSRRAVGHARLLCGALGKASRRSRSVPLTLQRRGESLPCALVARNPKS